VVAAGIGDYSAFAVLLWNPGDCSVGAPDFEGADGLEMFTLRGNWNTKSQSKGRDVQKRGANGNPLQSLCSIPQSLDRQRGSDS